MYTALKVLNTVSIVLTCMLCIMTMQVFKRKACVVLPDFSSALRLRDLLNNAFNHLRFMFSPHGRRRRPAVRPFIRKKTSAAGTVLCSRWPVTSACCYIYRSTQKQQEHNFIKIINVNVAVELDPLFLHYMCYTIKTTENRSLKDGKQ